jgi:hypothetical protein
MLCFPVFRFDLNFEARTPSAACPSLACRQVGATCVFSHEKQCLKSGFARGKKYLLLHSTFPKIVNFGKVAICTKIVFIPNAVLYGISVISDEDGGPMYLTLTRFSSP